MAPLLILTIVIAVPKGIHTVQPIDLFATKQWRLVVAVLAQNRESQEQVDALVTRFVTGELSEDVFKASLRRYLSPEDIRFLVMINQLAHRNSLPFRRGEVA